MMDAGGGRRANPRGAPFALFGERMKIIRDLRRLMGTIRHHLPQGGLLPALWVGALVGAFVVADGLFGFEFAGPYRSPYEPPPRPSASRVYPDEPCIPAPCDASEIPGEWGCCQGTEEWYLAAPDTPDP